jgi:hypothetical protein
MVFVDMNKYKPFGGEPHGDCSNYDPINGICEAQVCGLYCPYKGDEVNCEEPEETD